MYRSSEMRENEWKNRAFRKVFWNNKKTGNSHELIHLDVPLRLTFYWDPLLALLPSYIASWMAGNSSKPTYLITAGTTLHFMQVTQLVYFAEGIEASSRLLFNHLKEISPLLEEFSKTTQIVFKLQDHLKVVSENEFMNRRLVDRGNQISYELLPRSSNLTVWSSTVPLSDIYWEECRRRGSRVRHAPIWKCWNTRHLGFIMIDQFLDMFLNGVCCRFDNKGS
ncbi:uncharacterized protein [Macrobrachium rosenbergii]|uniref:uncharacterized protein n=1 Tax=Macrobrachium rosenbergii TaxID=79674 RepID=UPI0034D67E1A